MLKCPTNLLLWLSCRILFFMLASFGIYHLFLYNRKSFFSIIFGSIGIFFWVTPSHIATHCGSFNPASRRSSLNWLHHIEILNTLIFIWPSCHISSIVIWLDSPSSSVNTHPCTGVIFNLSWLVLNKHCIGCTALPSLGWWSSSLNSASSSLFFSLGL